MIRTFRTKPVIVKAIQFNGNNINEIKDFVGDNYNIAYYDTNVIITIHTSKGDVEVSKMDYIIQNTNGEYYICDPNIFGKTYELVFQI